MARERGRTPVHTHLQTPLLLCLAPFSVRFFTMTNLSWGGRGRTFKSCHLDQIKPNGRLSVRLYFICVAGLERVSETAPRRRRRVVG